MRVIFRKNYKLRAWFWTISFFLVGTLIALSFPFRYRVVATLGKGITAQNAPDGQSKADDEAPLPKGFNGVGRTGRTKSAAGRLERRNKSLVKFYQVNTEVFHFFAGSLCLLCAVSEAFL